MNIQDLLYYALISGLLSATIWNVLMKWRVIEKIELHTGWRCDFCLCFWINCAVCAALCGLDPMVILAPFAATSISHNLIK